MKQGSWYVYKPGYLALYGGLAAVTLLVIVGAWSSGAVVFPGLLGILWIVMTVRQLQLRSMTVPEIEGPSTK